MFPHSTVWLVGLSIRNWVTSIFFISIGLGASFEPLVKMEWQIAKSKALEYYRQEKYFKCIENAKIWLLWSKHVGNKHEEIDACKILGWSYYYLENYEESIKFGKEEFRVAKEESVKEAQLDAYLVFASSYKKLTPEKRSKETSLYKYASHPGIEERFSTLRFAVNCLAVYSDLFLPNVSQLIIVLYRWGDIEGIGSKLRISWSVSVRLDIVHLANP